MAVVVRDLQEIKRSVPYQIYFGERSRTGKRSHLGGNARALSFYFLERPKKEKIHPVPPFQTTATKSINAVVLESVAALALLKIVGSPDEHTSELQKWNTPAKTMCFTH
ncbi:hypothetical protein AMR41_09945 [Hapalosiphon sp. MRB220]|nr:hypothetical protein AMR41_09945 [Hapalosiphon sp. MRB220]